jgi:CheY-like chemotaxis protein
MTNTLEIPPRSLQTLLLVEDDDAIRTTLGSFFELLELNYLSVSNGEEAIALIRTQKVDILITDFRMPKVDGVELLKWCRTHGHHFPVIFVSANAELLEKENIALKDCCASLLSKPILLDDFEKALEAALARQHHEHCVHTKEAKVL